MKRYISIWALICGVAISVILPAAPAKALSVFDEEHYQTLLGKYGPAINQGPIGDGIYRPGFDLDCPYPIGSGKCFGRNINGITGGGVSASNLSASSSMDTPEEAESREGDGKMPNMDADDVSRAIQKAAIKKLFKRFVTRIPGVAPIIDVLWPTPTASDDVILNPRETNILDDDGNTFRLVPKDWKPNDSNNARDPDYARDPDLKEGVTTPDTREEETTAPTQDTEPPDTQTEEPPESNDDEGEQEPVPNTMG